jgi:predicted GNAT family N-acyltransferase
MMPIEIQMTDGKSDFMSAIFDLRHEVFVVEQHVPIELEIDEFDQEAMHFFALQGDQIVGTLRILAEDDHVKIGRVAVKKDHRKLGIGRKIMETAMNYIQNSGYTTIVLGAQLEVVPFYQKLGFVEEGEIFDDAGIDHIMMVKRVNH